MPAGWIVLIFAGVLLAAYTTEEIGIALIFGAFVMGLVMPRHAELSEDVTHRIEDFVVALLLPLFFAFTGLKTNIGLLDRPELWLLTVVLIAVAIFGKLVGRDARRSLHRVRLALVGGDRHADEHARADRADRAQPRAREGRDLRGAVRDAGDHGARHDVHGGPALKLLDPKNELGAPVEEELAEAREVSAADFPAIKVPDEAILVAPQGERALRAAAGAGGADGALRAAARADPGAARGPPRAAAVRGGLQTENRLLEEASQEVGDVRRELMESGVAARGVAFVSTDIGTDLCRLAQAEEVALMLIDGRRPLLGEGVPRGDVGEVLREAPCDVGVLVAKEDEDVVPGARLARCGAVRGRRARLGGARAGRVDRLRQRALRSSCWARRGRPRSARRSRACSATPACSCSSTRASTRADGRRARPRRSGRGGAGGRPARGGLSERWRDEGLGPTRSEIAKAAPAPVLFVRRGMRPGALAPREDVTRFGWSVAGVGPPPGGISPGETIK